MGKIFDRQYNRLYKLLERVGYEMKRAKNSDDVIAEKGGEQFILGDGIVVHTYDGKTIERTYKDAMDYLNS